jgi:hypothetical protein
MEGSGSMSLALLRKFAFSVCGIGLLGIVASCGVSVIKPPPPEAVLAGYWNVTFDPPGLNEVLVFDEIGHIAQRIITTGSGVGAITDTDTNVHKSTSVNGNVVHIETNDGAVFDGTMNDDKNVITGRFSSVVVIGDHTISRDEGAATLTKQ